MKTRKQHLFEAGAAAAGAVFGTAGVYICPICTREFHAEAVGCGELSLEHVPPRALGGRAIILTCKECNNRAGHTVDAQAANRAKMRQFFRVFAKDQQHAGGPATLTMDGKKINVDVRREGDTITIKVLEANDPKVLQAHKEYMRSLSEGNRWDGEQFSITAAAVYKQRYAKVSDLRAAFLLCTAAFGYSFALAPSLKRVREQILNPEEEVLERWWLNASGARKKLIGIAEQAGVIVVCDGPEAVVLPYPPRGEASFDSLSDVGRSGAQIELKMTSVEWPTSFVAGIDRLRQKKA